MRAFRLDEMKGGWFIGDFSPSCFKTPAFEVACKHYKSGQIEAAHLHKIATEWTLITAGRVSINGHIYLSGDIVEICPGEAASFEALTDTVTVVVKVPSIDGDKFPGSPSNPKLP